VIPATDMPCEHCGAHPKVHRTLKHGRHSRGHAYEPSRWPMSITCGRCKREARLHIDGSVRCPVCSLAHQEV
jgi:DNA-directed RNA polymerase subunit RPC12/RpoP